MREMAILIRYLIIRRCGLRAASNHPTRVRGREDRHYPYRRIVIGLNEAGRSAVLFDDANGYETGGGATEVALLWQSREVPADNEGAADAADEGFSFAIAPGATKCILVDVALTEGLMPPGMHATDTLDYVVILRGMISLYLDEGEVEVGPGDIVVDRGVVHAWRNKGSEMVRMLVLNVDAAPVGDGATI
jgi:quercetin dioxygenase-like cupin family protein